MSMAELFARGYIRYSELCNRRFQEKMKSVAERVRQREGIDIKPPEHEVPYKKLKRLMEKVKDKQAELAALKGWDGLTPEYFRHSQAFYIQDTVRLSFECLGETTEQQVACCMHLVNEFVGCTVETDGMCVLRKKNGFFSKAPAGEGGYADVKLLVYAELGTFKAFDGTEMPLHIVGEVQLILDGYMKVKHKMHLVYELKRGSFDHKYS